MLSKQRKTGFMVDSTTPKSHGVTRVLPLTSNNSDTALSALKNMLLQPQLNHLSVILQQLEKSQP